MKEKYEHVPKPKPWDNINRDPTVSPRLSPHLSPRPPSRLGSRTSQRFSPRMVPRRSPRINPSPLFREGGEILPPPQPVIGHGHSIPGFFPNEVLLQCLGRQVSKFETSEWIRHKRHEIQIKCPKCILLSQLHSWVIDEEGVETESHQRHLRSNTYRGRLYLTTERLVFVPRNPEHSGYSIFISAISMLKIVRDQAGQSYLCCYVEDKMAPLPFATIAQAEVMLRRIANVRFEHLLRYHVTPEYDVSIPPSYAASQESISRLLNGHISDLNREDPKFKDLIHALGAGEQNCTVDPNHNGYIIGPKAHAVVYAKQFSIGPPAM